LAGAGAGALGGAGGGRGFLLEGGGRRHFPNSTPAARGCKTTWIFLPFFFFFFGGSLGPPKGGLRPFSAGGPQNRGISRFRPQGPQKKKKKQRGGRGACPGTGRGRVICHGRQVGDGGKKGVWGPRGGAHHVSVRNYPRGRSYRGERANRLGCLAKKGKGAGPGRLKRVGGGRAPGRGRGRPGRPERGGGGGLNTPFFGGKGDHPGGDRKPLLRSFHSWKKFFWPIFDRGKIFGGRQNFFFLKGE